MLPVLIRHCVYLLTTLLPLLNAIGIILVEVFSFSERYSWKLSASVLSVNVVKLLLCPLVAKRTLQGLGEAMMQTNVCHLSTGRALSLQRSISPVLNVPA